MLLRNVRVVLPARTIERASLLIEDGLITRIFDSSNPDSSQAASALDLKDLTIFPGFIDAHIHGAVGVDVMDASAEALRKVSRFLVTQGVTSWLPTLVPAPDGHYASAIGGIEKAMTEQGELRRKWRPSTSVEIPHPTWAARSETPLLGQEPESVLLGSQGPLPQELPPSSEEAARVLGEESRVLGLHYEGPFVNSSQCGALRSEHFRSFAGPSDLNALPVPESEAAVRLMTLAPEIEGGIKLIAELRKRGWVVAIGHTRAGIDLLDLAFEAGARHMTHFMNAMAPLHHRAPGPVSWGLLRDDVTCDVIADGIHLDPFVLRLLLKTKDAGRLSLISDAIAATGTGDGEYEIWGETITVKDGRTSNSLGSIAGSVITMLDAAKMMLSLGVSEVDVARMASTNPARLLGIDGECGSIEEGKRADLVALDGQRIVRFTIIGGRLAFEAKNALKRTWLKRF